MNANMASPTARPAARPPRRRAFTLIEMMVVVVIVAIVLGIAIPSFVNLTSGSSVRAGTRLVSAQVRLTRQHAISQRRHVALLFPATVTDLPDELCYVAMKPAYVTAAAPFTFVEWVDGARWLHIPRGAVIAEVDEHKGITDGSGNWVQNPNDNSPVTVRIDRAEMTDLHDGLSAGVVDVRALIFSPTGRARGMPGGTAANVTVAQITYSGGNWIPRNPGESGTPNWATPNQFNIEVNPFTGRIRIETPDEY